MDNNNSYLEKLICTNCLKEFDVNERNGLCTSCGKVLYPNYDLEKAKETLSKQNIQKRKVYNIWRFDLLRNTSYLWEGDFYIIKII